jgi:hypothetical protein
VFLHLLLQLLRGQLCGLLRDVLAHVRDLAARLKGFPPGLGARHQMGIRVQLTIQFTILGRSHCIQSLAVGRRCHRRRRFYSLLPQKKVMMLLSRCSSSAFCPSICRMEVQCRSDNRQYKAKRLRCNTDHDQLTEPTQRRLPSNKSARRLLDDNAVEVPQPLLHYESHVDTRLRR